MNLATYISLNSIYAGGVGSGRHKELYHVTLSKNISSIKKNGLTPQGSGKTNFSELAEGKVYLANKEALANLIENMKENFPNQKLSLVYVKVLEKDVKKNNEYFGDFDPPGSMQYTSGKIKPEHITKVESIKAGGPGSGCNPGQCGRPSTGAKAQQVTGKTFLKMTPKERIAYVKEHTLVGDKPKIKTAPTASPAERIYPHSGKGTMGVGKPADRTPDERLGKITGPAGSKLVVERPGNVSPLYKKSFDEQENKKEQANKAEMREWRQKVSYDDPIGTRGKKYVGRQTRTPSYDLTQSQLLQQARESTRIGSKIHEGDLVKTKGVTRAFDNRDLEFKNYKAGTILTVHNVLPQVGNNPQMLSVQYPGGDMVHVSTNDVRMHRTRESLEDKPYQQIRQELGLDKGIRKGKIEQQTKTSEGVTYTKLKPQNAGRPAGSGNVARQPLEWKQGQPRPDDHPLKGQFELAKGPRGNKLNDIFTFDLGQRSKQLGQGTARATVYDATGKNGGTSVIAWRDTTSKTGRVIEFNQDKNGYIKTGSQPSVSFKNIGHMSSFLNQRYGISLKLPGQSVAKRKKK